MNEEPPLNVACRRGDVHVAEALLHHGANRNKSDNVGITPLMIATAHGHGDIVRILCDGGKVDVDAQDDRGRTALYRAAESGQRQIMNYLIVHGANVNICAENARSPLIAAASKGHMQAVKLLISQGCPLSRDSLSEQTPFHHAVNHGYNEVVEFFIQEGLVEDINEPDKFGRTPFFLAAKEGHDTIARLIVDAGGDVSAVSCGYRPYDAAKKGKHAGITKLIMDVMAKKNKVSTKSKSQAAVLGLS